MAETKTCTKCKKELPVEYFCRRTGARDGLQGYCKSCISEYKKSKRRTVKTSKSFSSYKVDKCKHSKIRLLFGDDNKIVTFRMLAEMLGMTVKQVYTRWDLRGRPSRIKSLEFFSREYAVQRAKRIKRSTENLLRYMEATRGEKPKKEGKAKPVKKKRAKGNAEWLALSDDPR